MDDDHLIWMPAWKLRELIGDRELSPVELMTCLLNRVDRYQPVIAPFITIAHDQAMASARDAENAVMRGDELGPLHGIPISIKDLLITKGLRTTAGSLLFEDHVPEVDSVCSERLKNAGAIIFAKANTPEFGMNRRSVNLVAEESLCPWDTERSSGGSSGGSGVAVAAGLGPVSIGSDGGGSTRLPSAFNGLFGLQPSRGRIPVGPRLFDFPLEGIGPMTRDVRDAAITTKVLAGYDTREPWSMQSPPPDYVAELDKGIGDLRVAWSRDFGRVVPNRTDVIEVIHKTAMALGQHALVYDEPDLKIEDPCDMLARDNQFSMEKLDAVHPILPGHKHLSTLLAEAQRDPQMWQKLNLYVRDRSDRPTQLEYTMAISPKLRRRPNDRLEDIFEKYDLLMSPTIARTAFVCNEPGLTPWEYIGYTMIVNMSGYCGVSIPAGFVDGLPVGLHIIARPDNEALLLRAARVVEQILPWAQHKPGLTL